MKKVMNRGLTVGMIVWLLTITCTMPNAATQVSTQPTLSAEQLAATAVSIALTSQAGGNPPSPTTAPPASQPTQALPPTIQPSATQCYAMVTATTNANVRYGPGTAYDPPIGSLVIGATAAVDGKNADGTWWYIVFAGGAGGHGWIAASVVTASCIPSGLAIIAAPPLPTAPPPTATTIPPVVALPDLIITEYSWSPVPPHMGISFHVRIGAYNDGNGPSGAFTVQWWLTTSGSGPTCAWNVASLVAHGGKILQCDYTPGGWNNAYPSMVIIDSGHNVAESNESNNTWSAPFQIAP